ncbi:MAG: histidine phosphatase family protein [Sneathiellaceae bacterium]
MHRSRIAVAGAILLAAVLFLPPGSASANTGNRAALWSAIAEGRAVAVMRHALAPGTGDPAAFDPGDCATQRNLDAAGRAQARAIGAAFRQAGIDRAEIFSSIWCRCRQTADLLDLGPVTVLPALNSFFRDRDRGPAQIAALREFLAGRSGGTGPLVLVTHQVVITALTGIYPRSGELVVIAADGTGEVLGRLVPARP